MRESLQVAGIVALMLILVLLMMRELSTTGSYLVVPLNAAWLGMVILVIVLILIERKPPRL
ncbi:MAG: hypothetical protein ACE5FW_02880 [Candidatus Aenigmatarchaeota archaeon]